MNSSQKQNSPCRSSSPIAVGRPKALHWFFKWNITEGPCPAEGLYLAPQQLASLCQWEWLGCWCHLAGRVRVVKQHILLQKKTNAQLCLFFLSPPPLYFAPLMGVIWLLAVWRDPLRVITYTWLLWFAYHPQSKLPSSTPDTGLMPNLERRSQLFWRVTGQWDLQAFRYTVEDFTLALSRD